MALEYRNGKAYYYRKKRYGNRVVSEYIGSGKTALLIAWLDKLEQKEKELKKEEFNNERLLGKEADKVLKDLETKLNELFTTVALASGYHKSKRQWRKKRIKN